MVRISPDKLQHTSILPSVALVEPKGGRVEYWFLLVGLYEACAVRGPSRSDLQGVRGVDTPKTEILEA